MIENELECGEGGRGEGGGLFLTRAMFHSNNILTVA